MLPNLDPTLLSRYESIINDPWEFCRRAVFTRDEVDKRNPVKAFPSHYEYLHYYTRVWQREKLLVVPKSRRMFMSWCNLALFLHENMFNLHQMTAFQSKKEEDSDSLIDRAEFILKHIPDTVIPKELVPRWKRTYCEIQFPDIGGRIVGVAQGADQLRQFTCSALLFDEFAFWDEQEESLAAAKPTIEGGGRLVIISSAAPSYMKKVVFDELDDDRPEIINGGAA